MPGARTGKENGERARLLRLPLSKVERLRATSEVARMRAVAGLRTILPLSIVYMARPVHIESLAKRYAQLAPDGLARRRVDYALRALDILISAFALLILSPLWILAGVSILVSSGRPVFYGGRRVGQFGDIFTMFKFRTLKPDAEDRLGPYYGEELTRRTNDEVTQLGRWLRASQLDEIPQLGNVLVGDMSIVGPRPIRPKSFGELVEEVPQYWQRLVVRPALTGFAQTRMGREESWTEKLAHDLEYIADRSVRLYLRVVLATAWRVLRQSASSVWDLARRGDTRSD